MKDLTNVKELLVVVDVINGFVYEGNMKDEYIAHIIPGIEKLVREYVKDNNKEVFYIRDAHSANSLEFKKFPLHCLDESSESEMVETLRKYQDDVRTYKKNSTSAMFAKGFMEDLDKMIKLNKVTIVGCCSDICVFALSMPLVNYFDEHNKDVKVEIIEELIETYDAPNHNRNEYNEISKKLLTQIGVTFVKEGRGRC